MNILFLLRLYPVYGGGETVTICLANEMVKRGWNVNILYFKDNLRNPLPYIDQRIKATKIEEIKYDEFSPEKTNKLRKERKIVQNYTIQFIHKNNIDAVINQWWPLCFINNIKTHTNAKVIKAYHTTLLYTPVFDGKGFKATLKKLFRHLYKTYKQKVLIKAVTDTLPYVDRFVFLSTSFQKQYETLAHYTNTGKLSSIPNPLVFDQFISPEKYAKKENIVLIVARMIESTKKITRALRSWKLIENDLASSNWKLQIVGEGPDLSTYKQMANELKLERVSFEGYQQPLPYYEKAKIFLMTSAIEGFGMTLIESQQQGVVPIVMDTFLALHDIIISGQNGIITPDGDEIAFAKAILSLMKDPNLTHKLAQQALITCRKFSVETIVDKWEDLINNI